MKKFCLSAIILAVGFLLLVACTKKEAVASSEKPVVIKVAYENHPGEPTDVSVNKWADYVQEMSGGKVVFELFPSSQLGSKKDVTEQILTGSNIITISDPGFLMDYVADIGILYAPYLTDSYDEYFKLVDSDWFQKKVAEVRDNGIEVVTAKWVYGDRHLLSTKPVRTPADMAGLKLRTPNVDILINTIKAMGAIPTPLPLSEVYSALSQGTINGMENPLPVILGSKMYESAKYVTLTGHVKNVSVWIGSSKFFESLPADVSKAIFESAEKASMTNNQSVRENEANALQLLKDNGVEIIEDADLAAFRDSVKPLYNEMWRPGLYDEVQQIIRK